MSRNIKTSDVSKMVRLIIKWSRGAINKQRHAEYVLLGFCIVAISVSSFLILNIGRAPYIPLPYGTKIVYSSDEPPRIVRMLVFQN